jgi:F-type H+-transporting ATPase subunit epsilon
MALPSQLRLEFVTPAQAIVHEQVDEVQLPGEEGHFGVLPGHAPMLAALSTGAMWYRKGTEITYAFVDGGFVEVLPDRVSVLAQVAERAEDIDIERAEAAKRRAEEQLSRASVVTADAERARIAMLRALARLQVSRQMRPPRA